MDAVDTIAAVATSLGIGGIGIVRVSGPLVPSIITGVTRTALRPRVATFVRFRDDAGIPIDEGIALYFPAPRSYTGEDVLELHGHGGPVVLRSLLQRCLEKGARLAQPGEFTKRAFLNGKLDLAQAEAVADLIAATTEQAARSAAQSLTGEFSRRVTGFQAELTELRVLIEGSLDFPDEGIDFVADADVPRRLDQLLESVEQALRAGTTGRLLQDGVTVALIGAPNAGKSSIINVLCNDDVAIVTPIPGTTRDVIRATVQFEGIPIHILDTAGLRSARDPVEALGIARTWRAISSAQVILVVNDASDASAATANFLQDLPADVPRIQVHNKIDLVGQLPRLEYLNHEPHVWVSAKLNSGLDLLRCAVIRLFAPLDASAGAFSAREHQLQALTRAAASIKAARACLLDQEIAAEELRLAQCALSEVTGEVVADDLLGEIFSRFCIGK